MKFAFISDIHGNALALDAVLEDINQNQVDQICVLGDLCFRGLEPNRCLEKIRALKCQVIKGNADEWVVRGIRNGEVPDSAYQLMKKERDWTLSQLDQDCIDYLVHLPTDIKIECGNIKIHAFHATPSSIFDVIQPFEEDHFLIKKMMGYEADIYLYAHIHKPFIRYINGKCIINTGSVGLPFDGMNKASYSIVEIDKNGFQTSVARVNYNVKKVIQQFQESDYPNSELMIKMLINAGN